MRFNVTIPYLNTAEYLRWVCETVSAQEYNNYVSNMSQDNYCRVIYDLMILRGNQRRFVGLCELWETGASTAAITSK